MPRACALAFTLLLALAALWSGCGREPGRTQTPEAKVIPGGPGAWPIIQRGTVTTLKQVRIESRRSTQVRSLLPDGTRVQAGDPLCSLVMADREDELKKRRSDLESARVTFRKAKEGQVYDRALAGVKLELARVEQNRTEEELQRKIDDREWLKIVEESESQRVRRLEIDLQRRKIQARLAMEKKGFGAAVERLTAEEELARLQLETDHADRLLAWLKATPVEKEVREAAMAREAASFAFALAAMEQASQGTLQEVRLDSARQSLEEVASRVRELEMEIASGTIVASVSGMVVRGTTWSGSGWEKVSEGDRVFPGKSFMSILNLETLAVEVPLEQRFAGQVKPGCFLRFRADACPERLFTAIATEVPAVAMETQFRDPDGERALTVRAALREPAPQLRVGFSGTVEVFPPGSATTLAEAAPLPSARGFQLTAREGPVRREVTLPGEVKARKRSLIAPAFSARLAFLAEDGVRVKKGETVARLETSELEKGLGDLKIQLENKTQQLALQRQKNQVELGRWTRTIRIREKAMKVAALEHESLITRRNETEIINLGKNRDLLAARLTLARETASHTAAMRERGMASELEIYDQRLESSRLERDQAVNAYKLELETDGPTRRQLRLSALALGKAVLEYQQAVLEAAQASFTARMDEEGSIAEISKIRLEVGEKEDRLRQAALPAPQEGVVILPEVWKEGEMGKMRLGDQANRQIPFMHVADLNSLEIAVEVAETDVVFLAPGQPVRVSVKSAPGRHFPGWISEVGAVAETDLLERQDALVEVFVALTNPGAGVRNVDEAFRPGASCEVQFKLYNIENPVIAPFEAVVPTVAGPALLEAGGGLVPLPLAFSDGLAGFVVSGQELLGRSFAIPELSR